MYERQAPRTSSPLSRISTPLSTPPPPSPFTGPREKALSPVTQSRKKALSPVAQTREKADTLEKKRLAVEGARKAYENVKANPHAINQMLRTFEGKLKKAEKAYEEAKAA